jgi:hypothetical protein
MTWFGVVEKSLDHSWPISRFDDELTTLRSAPLGSAIWGSAGSGGSIVRLLVSTSLSFYSRLEGLATQQFSTVYVVQVGSANSHRAIESRFPVAHYSARTLWVCAGLSGQYPPSRDVSRTPFKPYKGVRCLMVCLNMVKLGPPLASWCVRAVSLHIVPPILAMSNSHIPSSRVSLGTVCSLP